MSLVTPTPKKAKTISNTTSSSSSKLYNRKNKSLSVLAENFINKFRGFPSGHQIIVDQAATSLGVERRRIYDVVNILEAIRL
ncbi:MAG: hypothetical protein SGARI_007896, partial [Bacillariaceae sp.]